MEIAERFRALTDEWEAHRQSVLFSSKIRDTLNHPAYRALVDLGDPALPLIIERYRTDSLPWAFVLQEITGVRMIDDPGSFRPDELRRRWIDWWERKQGAQAR